MEDKHTMGKLLLPTLFLFLAFWLFGGSWWYAERYYPDQDQNRSIGQTTSTAQVNGSNQVDHFYPIPIRPSNIYFQGKQYDLQLTPEMKVYLNDLQSYLKEVADAQLLITGYTDNTGKEKSNLALSKNRAEHVRQLLLDLGFQKNQLSTQYRGSKDPIASNKSETGRAKNRRVEIRIR
jgi:Outer membrane protein and related peptidoglycan-associated (lipo)proteins